MNHNTCTTSVTSNQSTSRADLRHYQAAMTGRRQIWNFYGGQFTKPSQLIKPIVYHSPTNAVPVKETNPLYSCLQLYATLYGDFAKIILT